MKGYVDYPEDLTCELTYSSPRHLREKTTIAVTSRGYYGLEEEKGTACTSTRRRSTPRSLAGLTSGVFESIMVQVLRQEEQQRAKEEKR